MIKNLSHLFAFAFLLGVGAGVFLAAASIDYFGYRLIWTAVTSVIVAIAGWTYEGLKIKR